MILEPHTNSVPFCEALARRLQGYDIPDDVFLYPKIDFPSICILLMATA